MAIAPTAATISVAQTLALLDGKFKSVADGIANDDYAFWLGSGISLGRVDGLRKLVPRVLEFLRARIDPNDSGCRFRTALNAALGLATLSADERKRVNIATPFPNWPDANSITDRLINNYARLLDVQIAGEPADYLLWNGIDIAATFADTAREPDVEHLCMALLMLEGVATEVATANWDGLIEKAAYKLTGGQPTIVTCVRRENLHEQRLRSWLYKFHGCAVRAVANEADYRPFLVGRASQIHGWAARQENQALATKLRALISSKPTLMIGLSAQDANIQALFALAESNSSWSWPGNRPSFVFAGDQIGPDQQGMLQNVYRTSITPANFQQVIDGAVIQAYAKPLLIALTLYVICAKICKLIDIATTGLADVDRTELRSGAIMLRNLVSDVADGDRIGFVNALVDHWSRFVCLYRDGNAGAVPRPYNPLTTVPLHLIQNDMGVPASGLCEFAVACGILGIGVRDGLWAVDLADVTDPASGVVVVTSRFSTAIVLFVDNSHTALRLQQNGHIASKDAVLVHSVEMIPAVSRSPRTAPGRTGKLGPREVSVRDLLSKSTSFSDLMQRFRESVTI